MHTNFKRRIGKILLLKLKLTLKVKIDFPQNNSDLSQSILQLWSKFGNRSWNRSRAIVQTSLWLTHGHTHTDSGNDNSLKAKKWPRGQGHEQGKYLWPNIRCSDKSISTFFILWQSDYLFLRYSKVKDIMDGHIWRLAFNWPVTFSFRDNKIFLWDRAYQIFDFEILRSRSWPKSQERR